MQLVYLILTNNASIIIAINAFSAPTNYYTTYRVRDHLIKKPGASHRQCSTACGVIMQIRNSGTITVATCEQKDSRVNPWPQYLGPNIYVTREREIGGCP